VGEGPLRGDLMRQIAANRLQSKITILDPVTDLVPYFHACDVFALPSCEASEVFAIVQIEAMACGKPVVNTALPTGVPEVSVDGITGKTVPPKDARALGVALTEILSNAEERNRFSENALREAQTRFSKEKFVSELERYF
jgi:rhamnosyl/mannosyltransferase